MVFFVTKLVVSIVFISTVAYGHSLKEIEKRIQDGELFLPEMMMASEEESSGVSIIQDDSGHHVIDVSEFCSGNNTIPVPDFVPINSKEKGTIVPNSRCYDGLGCFGNEPPFDNAIGKIPDTLENIDIKFVLYTKQNTDSGHILLRNDKETLSSSHFNSANPTIFLIHGFQGSWDSGWMRDVRREILSHMKEVNVIQVGWKKGAEFPYEQATSNTRVVGALIGELINFLSTHKALKTKDVHLVGFSLGAQTAGYVGEKVKHIGRITGLDPAGPNYEGLDSKVRLDKGDAEFVDVIHTDGSIFTMVSGYGTFEPSGHIDFYPNGGLSQPGCGLLNFGCSHSRAPELFLESIRSPCDFTAYPCTLAKVKSGHCTACNEHEKGCGRMGQHSEEANTEHDIYHLSTNKKSPYCRG